MNHDTVRLNVQERRRELGWSQSFLANKIGVSRQTLIAIEHGRTRIHLDLAVALADALQMPLDTLVGRNPRPDQWRWLNDRVPTVEVPVVWAEVMDQRVVVPYHLTGDTGQIDAWWDPKTQQLDPTSESRHPSRVILVGGCDPRLSWLKAAFEQEQSTHLMEILPASSTTAMTWLRQGFLHLAGSHWYNPALKAYNVFNDNEDVSLARVGYLQWEEGVFWHPDRGEPRRWAVREVGSEARAVFERTKSALQFPTLGPTFDRHLDLTRYVLSHPEVGGLGLGSLAATLGLSFRALTQEPYEWILRQDDLNTPWFHLFIQALEQSDLKTLLEKTPHQAPFQWAQIR